MDVLLGLSYGIALLLAGASATVYWGNGSKSVALWLLVAGVVWCILTAGLQAQILIAEAVEPKSAQFEADRANIKLINFFSVPIQDNPGEPLKGWAIQPIFKNVGKTDARQVA